MAYYNVYPNSSDSEEEEEDDDDDDDDIWTEEEDSTKDRRNFTVHFFGTDIETTVTSNPSVIRRWIYYILYFHRYRRHQLVVGLGVQWRQTASTDGSGDPADTLQLCIGTRCLIIQLSHLPSVPKILQRFLTDEQNTFVGIRNYSDEKKLLRSRHRLSVHNIQNLGKIVTSQTGENHLGSSMECLASDILDLDGVKKDPTIGRSNWNAKNLSIDQVEYACVDAHVSFLIGRKFEA